jgi:hypothetical protein
MAGSREYGRYREADRVAGACRILGAGVPAHGRRQTPKAAAETIPDRASGRPATVGIRRIREGKPGREPGK